MRLEAGWLAAQAHRYAGLVVISSSFCLALRSASGLPAEVLLQLIGFLGPARRGGAVSSTEDTGAEVRKSGNALGSSDRNEPVFI